MLALSLVPWLRRSGVLLALSLALWLCRSGVVLSLVSFSCRPLCMRARFMRAHTEVSPPPPTLLYVGVPVSVGACFVCAHTDSSPTPHFCVSACSFCARAH